MSYAYRRTVTIDHTKVSSSLTDFPVLIAGTYAYLKSIGNGGQVTSTNGHDIIFTSDSAGMTQLAHEIESYSANTGAVAMWVKVPTVSSSVDTVIYLWYGDSSVTTSQQNRSGTWSSSFSAVWHLGESSGTTLSDAVGSNSLTKVSSSAPSPAAAIIGGGQTFSNNNADRESGVNLPVLNASQTVSLWYLQSSVPSMTQQMVCIGDGGAAAIQMSFRSSALRVEKSGGNTILQSPSAPSSGTWHHVVYTYDGTTNRLYVDGTEVTNNTNSVNSGSPDMIHLGSTNYNTEYFAGTLDEVRIASVTRSAAWIAAEYGNQNSPSSWYSVSGASSMTALTATMSSLSATVNKRISHNETATNSSFSGTASKATSKPLSAITASFTATLTRMVGNQLTATLDALTATLTGYRLGLLIEQAFTAAMSAMSATANKLTTHNETASTNSMAGQATRSTMKRLQAVSDALAGVVSKAIRRKLSATTASMIGSAGKGFSHGLNAVLTGFSAVLTWVTGQISSPQKNRILRVPADERVIRVARDRRVMLVEGKEERTLRVPRRFE
ncbi:MAG TPA: DUF2341 domain-containing protein [Bryobacteraceae bacterium]|nr:DUF2341 domain-containing protein [Bryobacteraceae bacterium]